jgi:energy-converting hydrogenase Eha subunit F
MPVMLSNALNKIKNAPRLFFITCLALFMFFPFLMPRRFHRNVIFNVPVP